MAKGARAVCLMLLAACMAGCAGAMDYDRLEARLEGGRCAEAYEYMEQTPYGPGSGLLYLMDRGAMAMYCGDHAMSNEYLRRAEALSDELWTKSLTREAAAFVLNDYTVPYGGEDFELAQLNLLMAINHMMLGEPDEALVECRRLDLRLGELGRKYEGEPARYQEDALGRYLSGMIYESTGDLQNAFVAYHKAYEAYEGYQKRYGTPVPEGLLRDMAYAGERVGRSGELARELGGGLAGRLLEAARQERAGGAARLVFIHFSGRAPRKVEDLLIVPTRHGPVSVAFPRFEVRMPVCDGAGFAVGSGYRVGVELGEDINAIAVGNLEDRAGVVMLRTVARVAAKQALIEQAARGLHDPVAGDLLRFGLNTLNLIVERADTRSWRMLPGEIYIGSAFVPEGEYAVYGEHCGQRRDMGRIRAEGTRVVPFVTRD